MNKYRVTFLTPSGLEQRTIMEANSLPDLIKKVESIMKDPLGYFTNDKNNCYFQAVKENVSYIQYELLFSSNPIHLERLKELSSPVLQSLFQRITSPEVYALALKDIDKETRGHLFKEMQSSLKAAVEEEMRKCVDATAAEVYEAQSLLLNELAHIANRK